MSNDAAEPATAPPAHGREDSTAYRRVLLSSFLGSAIEYYDFLLYGAAASLVFGPLFFHGQGEAVALLMSFATFAVGYVMRPLGGVIFGGLGDRIGRKASLFTTMLMMGIASCAIGLLPTSEQVGALAPVLLVLIRIVQGLAVGGEWGGAALMALEHSPTQRRGFGASVANMGGPAGGLAAAGIFAAFSALPHEAFMSWGWRIPFLMSSALVVTGLFVRLKVAESPVFEAARKQRAGKKQPLAIWVVIRDHRRQLVLASATVVGALVFQTFFATFAMSMVTQLGASSTAALLCKGFGSLVNVFAIGYCAHLSDSIGRRKVILAGACVSIAAVYPILIFLGSGSVPLVLLGYALGNIVQAGIYGPVAAYVSELFGTGSRYTGAAVSYQLGAIVGGFTPFIATSLWELGRQHVAASGWAQYSLVGLFLIAGCLVTIVAVLVGKETRHRALDNTAEPMPAHPTGA